MKFDSGSLMSGVGHGGMPMTVHCARTQFVIAAMAGALILCSLPARAQGKGDPLIAGIKLYDKGQYEQAIKQLTKVFEDQARSRADTATALYYRGKTQHRLKHSDAALADIKAALWLNQLSPAQSADAKRLEDVIVKAAAPDAKGSASAPPEPAPTTKATGWTTSAPTPAPRQSTTTPPTAPSKDSAASEFPTPWRDSRRDLNVRDEQLTMDMSQPVPPPSAISSGSLDAQAEPTRLGVAAFVRPADARAVRFAQQSAPDLYGSPPTSAGDTNDALLPGFSTLTSWFADPPTPVDQEIEAARLLEEQRLQRIRRHNESLQQNGRPLQPGGY